jgi:hypothetical protein
MPAPSRCVLVVARNLGHSASRMVEKRYGHLTSSYIREAIGSAKAVGIGDNEANIVLCVDQMRSVGCGQCRCLTRP